MATSQGSDRVIVSLEQLWWEIHLSHPLHQFTPTEVLTLLEHWSASTKHLHMHITTEKASTINQSLAVELTIEHLLKLLEAELHWLERSMTSVHQHTQSGQEQEEPSTLL